MIPPNNQITPAYIIKAFRRRFWYVVLPFFLAFSGAIFYCIKAPRLYRAQTLILVEPQKVPHDYVRSTVTIDLGDRLRTISEQITSRTNLETIIKEFDLYSKLRAEMTMTDAVDVFRKNIDITVRKPTTAAGSGGAFEISYTGNDPVKVRDVANKIMSLFIDDNLRLREAQAAGTTRFLDRELVRLKEDLRERETVLREFKEQYMEFLPEHIDKNYRMITLLAQERNSIDNAIQQTKDRLVLLESQLSNIERMAAQSNLFAVDENLISFEEESTYGPAGAPSENVAQLQKELDAIKMKYSSRHPDVIRLEATIAKLQSQSEGEPFAEESAEEKPEVSAPEQSSAGLATFDSTSLFDVQRQEMSSQLQLVKREINKLEAKRDDIDAKIAVYQDRIEKGPRIEQMLLDSTRGYDESRQNYEALLKKKLEAELAENLERAQQGEQFRVLDSARLPDTPFSPDAKKIMALGLVLALASGLGAGYLRERADKAFWDGKHLEDAIGIPLLVSVPLVNTESELRKALAKKVGAAAVLASMALICSYGLFVLWKMESTRVLPLG